MLSLSMIVRDEADRIEACLASVRGLANEMVVVDTGSTDDTVQRAEAAGARVEHLPWPGDFAPARNAALEHVKGDWVLVLDADEQLLPEAIPALQELMTEPDVLVINLLRYERGAAMAPYSSVSRLFRRHPRLQWSRPYHSMIDDSVEALLRDEPQWRIVNCSVPALLHDGYRPELLQGSDKAQRLQQAMEQWLSEQPGDPYACAKLGALEVAAGNRNRGVALLHQGLASLGESMDRTAERYELLLHLAMAQRDDDPTTAIATYQQALDLPMEPRLNLGARLNLAVLLMETDQLEEAIKLTTTATEQAPEVALGWYNLGLMQRRRGDIAAAINAYTKAIQRHPNHPECHQNLALALLMGGDIDGARNGFRLALDLLQAQGRNNEAKALRSQVEGLVKLNEAGR
ncbi:glycosyltransferase family 2 protein [Synechococcus sp. UW140]|uniref:glycosyltransferase family 2 protein n=1 Tax=Synechococcus sp. UW140 TaxID=368503 RepID=UPI000E0F61DC|nr:glycosyltransferase family 2 protein [Synechococcus sp. UW140]